MSWLLGLVSLTKLKHPDMCSTSPLSYRAAVAFTPVCVRLLWSFLTSQKFRKKITLMIRSLGHPPGSSTSSTCSTSHINMGIFDGASCLCGGLEVVELLGDVPIKGVFKLNKPVNIVFTKFCRFHFIFL